MKNIFYLHLLLLDFFLEILEIHGWQLGHFPLKIVAMPVGLVVLALNVGVAERHIACDTCENCR